MISGHISAKVRQKSCLIIDGTNMSIEVKYIIDEVAYEIQYKSCDDKHTLLTYTHPNPPGCTYKSFHICS